MLSGFPTSAREEFVLTFAILRSSQIRHKKGTERKAVLII